MERIIESLIRAKKRITKKAFKNKLRRNFLCTFHKKEVIDNLKFRHGECLQCGRCCELLFKCPFLVKNGQGTKCLIYNIVRPNSCKMFPIDRRDIEEVNFKCGYYFPVDTPILNYKKSSFMKNDSVV